MTTTVYNNRGYDEVSANFRMAGGAAEQFAVFPRPRDVVGTAAKTAENPLASKPPTIRPPLTKLKIKKVSANSRDAGFELELLLRSIYEYEST
ncbi:hypothetical protein KQX54_019799 [Cotesia glomerata]|uniref:Uncharacterized protein n=1 Tax=Cotesia glomerata TaxID=32391 RepID=A0AAV7HFL3_COTGL|nr:hypothetical protein KQX54_019799 [Cotesia glomerata]